MNNTNVEITAGLGGFLVLFFLAIALIFLGFDLSKRLRRLNHQEELRLEEERILQERRAQEAGASAEESGGPQDEAQTQAPTTGLSGEDDSRS